MAGPRSEAHAAVQNAVLARTGLTRDFSKGQRSSGPEVMKPRCLLEAWT